MIFDPTEKSLKCPWCGVEIDVRTTDFVLDKAVLMDCPWCGHRLRVWKRLRLKPKKDRGLYFVVRKALKRTGSGRTRVYPRIKEA